MKVQVSSQSCGGSNLRNARTSSSPFLNFFATALTRYYTRRMLYLIGLGLADEKDISVRGLEIVKRASRVYLEAYTAILLVDKDALVSGVTDSHTRY